MKPFARYFLSVTALFLLLGATGCDRPDNGGGIAAPKQEDTSAGLAYTMRHIEKQYDDMKT